MDNIEVVEEVIPLTSNDETTLGEDSSPVDQEIPDSEGDTDMDIAPASEEAPKIIKCLKCNKEFSCVRSLKRHVASFHEKNNQCSICDKHFRSEKELSQHVEVHLGFNCNTCGNKYSTADSLRSHKNRKHPNTFQATSTETVSCDLCDKTFKNNNGLKAHKSKIHKALDGASSEDGLNETEGQGEGSSLKASSSFPSVPTTLSADAVVSTAAPSPEAQQLSAQAQEQPNGQVLARSDGQSLSDWIENLSQSLSLPPPPHPQ